MECFLNNAVQHLLQFVGPSQNTPAVEIILNYNYFQNSRIFFILASTVGVLIAGCM